MATYYVNSTSSAGGDGTTDTESGGTRAFSTLAEAVSTIGSLSEATTIYCSCGSTASNVDSDSVTLNTTFLNSYTLSVLPNPSCSQASQSNQAHGGALNTSAYRREYSGSSQTANIIIEGPNVTIDGLQINTSNTSTVHGVNMVHASTTGCTISNNIIYNTSASGSQVGINASQGTNDIYNNIIYDWAYRGFNVTGSQNCYNNHIIDCGLAVRANDTNVVFQNTLIYGCTTAFNGTPNSASDYNVTELASLGYTPNTNDIVSGTLAFTDYANDDFSITSGATSAVDNGTSKSGVFTTDVIGTSRPQGSTWDRGAFELVSGGGSSVIPIFNLLKQQMSD